LVASAMASFPRARSSALVRVGPRTRRFICSPMLVRRSADATFGPFSQGLRACVPFARLPAIPTSCFAQKRGEHPRPVAFLDENIASDLTRMWAHRPPGAHRPDDIVSAGYASGNCARHHRALSVGVIHILAEP
jgi:hypothetical protein